MHARSDLRLKTPRLWWINEIGLAINGMKKNPEVKALGMGCSGIYGGKTVTTLFGLQWEGSWSRETS